MRLGAVEVESKRNNFSENIACINNIHEIDSLLAAGMHILLTFTHSLTHLLTHNLLTHHFLHLIYFLFTFIRIITYLIIHRK